VLHLFLVSLHLVITLIKGPTMGTIIEADDTYTKSWEDGLSFIMEWDTYSTT